jgi:hypothetical protein
VWPRWRRKQREAEARAVYRAKRRAGVLAEAILAGIDHLAAQLAGEPERFWPSLAEWLRTGRWMERHQAAFALPLAGGAGPPAAAAAETVLATSLPPRRPEHERPRAHRSVGHSFNSAAALYLAPGLAPGQSAVDLSRRSGGAGRADADAGPRMASARGDG